MAARSTNTMVEVLQRFLGDIAQAKTAIDADLPFLDQLEQIILQYLRSPQQQMQQAGLPPGFGQSPPAGAGMPMGGPPMGGSPPGPQTMPPQAGGLMAQGAAPNADELRRLLGG